MELLRERRSAQTVAGGGRGGAVEEVVEGLVLNSDVWEAERRVGWIRRVGWGVSEDRSKVQCCRAALGSPN